MGSICFVAGLDGLGAIFVCRSISMPCLLSSFLSFSGEARAKWQSLARA